MTGQVLALVVLFALLFTSVVNAVSPQPGKDTGQTGTRPGQPRDGHPGPRHCPPDIVLFGLTLKGEEAKPFLLTVPPLPPGKAIPSDEKKPTGQKDPTGMKAPPRPEPGDKPLHGPWGKGDEPPPPPLPEGQ